MYDIIIIGSGPAGSTFAKLIDKKYKVLLINGSFTFTKPCGGLLSPDAAKSLAKLKITMPKEILVDPQIFSVNTIDFDNNINAYYSRSYVNFNREKFDKWLLEMASKEVEVKNGIVVSIEKNTKYNIKLKTLEGEQILKSKYLIGADGAGSITRSTFFPNKRVETLLSIQEWYQDDSNNPVYSCIFDKEVTPTYAWMISKDNHLIYGGAYRNKKDFEKGKEKVTKLIPIKREACLLTNIKNIKEIVTGKDNVFLLGEAAGFISPSSYEGISYALETAIILSKVFNKNESNFNQIYNKKTRSLKLKIFIKIIKAKILQNKILRKIIIKSKIRTIKVIENEA